MTCKKSKGFTLIELMITVAIIGMLTALALPSYQNSIRKGKRAEARAALTNLMLQQERYMTQNNTYLSFDKGESSGNAASFKTFSGDARVGAAYLLGAEACDAPNTDLRVCVRVFAAPEFSDPEAETLQLTSTGTKSCTGTKSSICWN